MENIPAERQLLLVYLQNSHEGLLRHLHVADGLHALLAGLLLLQKLALAGDIAAVALGQHIFPHGPDSLPGDDFAAYRRAHDMRTVRRNVTLPSYLNELGEKAGLNFSQVLQDGLRQRLGVQ